MKARAAMDRGAWLRFVFLLVPAIVHVFAIYRLTSRKTAQRDHDCEPERGQSNTPELRERA